MQFQIAVAVVDENTNMRLKEWVQKGTKTQHYPSIAFPNTVPGCPPTGVSALWKALDNVGAAHRGLTVRVVQELMGQEDLKTTMTYTHVLNRGGHGVEGPADAL